MGLEQGCWEDRDEKIGDDLILEFLDDGK